MKDYCPNCGSEAVVGDSIPNGGMMVADGPGCSFCDPDIAAEEQYALYLARKATEGAGA